MVTLERIDGGFRDQSARTGSRYVAHRRNDDRTAYSHRRHLLLLADAALAAAPS